MGEEKNIMEKLQKRMNDYKWKEREYHIENIEIERSIDDLTNIVIDVWELYSNHPLRLKLYKGVFYGERITFDRCPECHEPKIERDDVELNGDESLEELIEKLRIKTERY